MAVLTGQFMVLEVIRPAVSRNVNILGIFASQTAANTAADAEVAKRVAAGDSATEDNVTYLVVAVAGLISPANRV